MFHIRLSEPPTHPLRPVIPNNARPPRITAAAGTELAAAASTGTVNLAVSSPSKGLYVPRDFITHAALLGQGFPHCQKFPTAASRRSLERVPVPLCPTVLAALILIVRF